MKIFRSRKLAMFMAITLTLFMGFSNALVPVFAESNDAQSVTKEVQWEGNGSEHALMTEGYYGWHWILTPGGNNIITEATLTVVYGGEEYTAEGYRPSGGDKGAMHFDVVGVPVGAEVTEAWAVFEVEEGPGGGPDDNYLLTISNKIEGEIEVPTGSITIEKELLDVDDEAITEDDTEFTVNVKGSDYDMDHSFSVDEPVVIEDLPLGDYTISEVHIPDGFELISIVEENVTLSEEVQAVTVVVTNQVEEDIVIGEPGALIIEKLLLDADEEEITDDDTTFMVNIHGEEYDEDHEFSVNEPLVLDDLEPGEYHITEINTPEGYIFVSISDEMVTISENNQEDVTVVVTNQVVEEEEVFGMLTIEKYLLDVDDEAITEDDTEFTVNVEGPYKYNEDHTFSVDEPVVIEDLPLGDYTISEVHIPDGFELISIEEENITLSEKLQAVTVVVTNQVEEDIVIGEPGALIIEKLLLDADDEEITDDDTMFMVNIQGEEYDEDHEFSVNEPLVLDELEPGDYYISELEIPEGFEFVEISHEMVTISEDNQEDITVVVTNQMVEEEEVLGMLTIEKYLLDVDGEQVLEDDTLFTVQVTGPFNYDEDHTFSVNDPAVIQDLPLGEYEISEKDIPEGYQLVTIDDVLVMLSVEQPEATVVVVNHEVEEDIVIGEPGALIIEKLLLDVDDEEITDDDTMFMVNIQGDEYDEDHEFSVNEPLVLDELEPGDYYITELSIPEGFEFVEISHEMVTLSENNEEDITVVVTNQAVEMLEDIEDEELPEGAPEEEIILDEEVPLGDGELPRTGQRHARDFYLLGLMISGLGVFMKRFYSRSSA